MILLSIFDISSYFKPFDSGFYKLDEIVTGKHLTARREGYNGFLVDYRLDNLRVYQMPNLLMELSPSITPNTSQPKASDLSALNLITNLSSRTCDNLLPPITSSAGPLSSGTTGSHKSCFMATDVELVNDLFVFGLDFKQSVFQHAIYVE